jgi:signal transduction histidine kinase
MTIKSQQRLQLAIIGVIFILMFVVVVQSNRISERFQETNQIMARIVKEISDINLVSGDYLLQHNDRPLTQIGLRLASISKLIEAVRLERPEHLAIRTGMLRELGRARQLFEQLKGTQESFYKLYNVEVSERVDPFLYREIEDQAARLSISSLALSNSAHRLLKSLAEKQARVNLFYDILILGGLLVSFVFLTAMFFGFSQRFVRSIYALKDGAGQIAGGNLQHRLAPKGSDEFSELGRAFDTMAASLQESGRLLEEQYRQLQHEMAERRETEEQIHLLNLTLEDKVQARTSELNAAVEALERSNKELEQFAYVASHDLQEPLRMISSFTQLLAQDYKGKLDKEADEYIHYVVDGANRMQRLIQDLLSYSRVASRGRPFEAVDMNLILGMVHSSLQLQIEEAGAVVVHDPMPVVMADSSQMIQLFQNLLSNSIKFRGTELPLIQVSSADEGDLWHITVRDNGIGIETQYFERIFLIFQRLHSREKFQGTGIGLAVCKRIVERHGGKIWVESVIGKGSTFHFTVPKTG